MNRQQTAYLRRLARLWPFALVLLGMIGIALSAFLGLRESRQYEAIESLRIAQNIDNHFRSVEDQLALRENLAHVVAGLFVPPPLGTPRAFGNFGSQVITLVPDITTLGWLPEVDKSQAPEALRTLTQLGVENPHFRDLENRPIALETLDRPLYPLLDIVPEKNYPVLGVDAGSFPDRLAAIRRARDERKIIGTTPLRLVQTPDVTALLLYAPVQGADGGFAGVIGFGYQVDRLLANVLNLGPQRAPFDIRVFAEGAGESLFGVASDGTLLTAASSEPVGETMFERNARFGARDLKFVYSMKRDLAREGLFYGLKIAGIGAALTICTLTFLGFMANRATVLSREVKERRSAEDRMKVLIHELNHRVRNVLAIAQAVVRLSFTPGHTPEEVQRTAEGRLQALANAMTLLTASDWKSVNLGHLISEEVIPFGDRITLNGPDLPLKARSAQTFALLLYELATNAAKHGALSVPNGRVQLDWNVDRSSADPIFRFRWREAGGPTVTPPTRRGFGELLVKRIAPRDVSGRGTASYEADGFVYELEAPLREIIYEQRAA